MSDDFGPNESDGRLEQLFRELPREDAVDGRALDRTVSALEAEGFLWPRRRGWAWLAGQVAAAIVLVLAGGFAGARIAMRDSLEARLERTDLSVSDRILLMQRAGSAYVRAANGYANAVARNDSTAVEVASRVLLGAAQAVARTNLDGGLTPDLTAALQTPTTRPVSASTPRIVWF
jgi:hypothetical protein